MPDDRISLKGERKLKWKIAKNWENKPTKKTIDKMRKLMTLVNVNEFKALVNSV